ncbi:relaxase/mobilization nuclease domain-containing protein [Pseudooceanicola atlanticus]|uniref:relaxase/mobilization nuclease domain-containing protein n=1 Tax=Pseudooceanicola atlanticus TaxID=1461694 RepID=UPI0023560ED7|nr:VirD2 family relaxase/mobilization nuclease [Pseudooceanicola atlanticus]
MSSDDHDFRIRPGRIRDKRVPRQKSFINQVIRAAKKSGHVSISGASGRGSGYGRSNFGRGRTRFARTRLFNSSRRVVVKARIVRHKGRAFRSAPLTAHVAYLKREGVTRDGERGIMFDAASDSADDRAFAERCEDDRHHFRFIVSPEDAADMQDLKAFTRDLARQMESDLGTRLDWIAVDHWNTDNPHVHLLVRGVDETGADLVISRDYISRGLRSRGEELVSLELGPKPEHEIRATLEKEVTAERWTRLDREIRFASDDTGHIDLRPDAGDISNGEPRRLMIGRLQHLEKMGLAAPAGSGEWMVGLEAERKLRDLGMRGDIIKTMHRAFTERGQDRGIGDFAIEAGDEASPIIGRLVDRGLHDELTGEAYAVIDGTDGRAHHIRFRGIEAFEHAPSPGGIVEVRRFGETEDRRPMLVLALRSDLDLKAQINAPGATWLDHRLVERVPMPLSTGGFGGEVSDAIEARAEHLAEEGFARRQRQRIILQRDLLNTLRRRELDTAAAKLSDETGLPYVKSATGEHVTGTYRQRLALSSGRFAMIDNGLGFQLVPWSPSLEKKLGQQVSGLVRRNGGVDWSFGRKRGLSL